MVSKGRTYKVIKGQTAIMNILTVPNAACNPATESPKLIFGRTGGPESRPVFGSGKPLIYLKPDSASQTEAYPGREAHGPV